MSAVRHRPPRPDLGSHSSPSVSTGLPAPHASWKSGRLRCGLCAGLPPRSFHAVCSPAPALQPSIGKNTPGYAGCCSRGRLFPPWGRSGRSCCGLARTGLEGDNGWERPGGLDPDPPRSPQPHLAARTCPCGGQWAVWYVCRSPASQPRLQPKGGQGLRRRPGRRRDHRRLVPAVPSRCYGIALCEAGKARFPPTASERALCLHSRRGRAPFPGPLSLLGGF